MANHRNDDKLNDILGELDALEEDVSRDLGGDSTEKQAEESSAASSPAPRPSSPEKKRKKTGKARRRRKKRIRRAARRCAFAAAAILLVLILRPALALHRAQRLAEAGNTEDAVTACSRASRMPFSGLFHADEKLSAAVYAQAEALRDAGSYEDAISLFSSISGYEDSESQAVSTRILQIRSLMESGAWNEAMDLTELLPDTQEEKQSLLAECRLGRAKLLARIGKSENAISELSALGSSGDAEDFLRNVRYNLALNLLQIYDFDGAKQQLEQAGDYADASVLLSRCENVFDAVYQTAYTDDAGSHTSDATSYMWVHTLIQQGTATPVLSMQEGLSSGTPDSEVFGMDMLNYVQYTQPEDYTYTFSYAGSENDGDSSRRTFLVASFSEDFQTMSTLKAYEDGWEELDHAQKRAWTLVTDRTTADTVRNGFRRKIEINLSGNRNPYFADATDSPDIPHYCSVENCTNEASLKVESTSSRTWFCSDHKEEYNSALAENKESSSASSAYTPLALKDTDADSDAASVTSSSALLCSADTGEILMQKDADARIYPASMTKVMTLLVAAEHLRGTNLSDTFTMTDEILNVVRTQNLSAAGFQAGESVTAADLLWGCILPSGADAALALCQYVAGSDDAFVEMMNKKAQDLGLSDTHFSNAVGIYDENNYTTVKDMAVIMKAAMDNPLAALVLSSRQYTTSATSAFHPLGITVSNAFLRAMPSLNVPGIVLAAKTGYVSASMYCAVSYECANDGSHYICVTASAPSSQDCRQDHALLYRVNTGIEEGNTESLSGEGIERAD